MSPFSSKNTSGADRAGLVHAASVLLVHMCFGHANLVGFASLLFSIPSHSYILSTSSSSGFPGP